MPENYKLRGSRVPPLSMEQINSMALAVAKRFKLNPRNRRKIDKSFESLFEFGITLNVVEDEEWIFVTKGHCDPSKLTISVPDSIYTNASNGERDALAVMLHEMGHLFLGHRPVLHFSDQEPTMVEDSEWQADTFAEAILHQMGYSTMQRSFDFYYA